MQSPTVSVCMITYGHEKYIREALEGVLMQECDFEVELILANDCSPDRTDEIIQDIIKNHPKGCWIKYFKHESNIGMMPNFIFALKECEGKYIALCEGDDYWNDPLKLQKQVSFLEANPDYVLCFHPIQILKTDGGIVDDFITNVPENYETIETLARLGNYIHTPSVVFRNILSEYPTEFELSPIGDYFLYMLLAENGRLKCLSEQMGVYRSGIGIWSQKGHYFRHYKTACLHALLCCYFKSNSDIESIFLNRIKHFIILFKDLITNEDISRLVLNDALKKEIFKILLERKNIMLKKRQFSQLFKITLLMLFVKIKMNLSKV